jgi:hypothetical protein
LLASSRHSTPLLHRVRGYALALSGDSAAAQALEASVAAARAEGNLYELAVSLHAARTLRDRTGAAPVPEEDAECAVLLARLDVEAVPAPPLAPVTATV